GAAAAALTVLHGAPLHAAPGAAGWSTALTLFATLLVTGDTLFEETGWRAFALPRFRASRSRLATGLILGVILAGWHLPIALAEPGALAPYVIATIASAVVTNWV